VGGGGLNALTVSLVVALAGLAPLMVIATARGTDRAALGVVLRDIRTGSLPLTRWFLWAAGLIGAIFTAVQAAILPLLGLTLFVVAVVAGRTTAALLVDHIGLAHGGSRRITGMRILAVLVTVLAVGIPLLGQDDPHTATASIAVTVIALIIGGSLAVQGAAGSHLRERTTPVAATVVIYIVTIVLLGVLVVPWMLLSSSTPSLPGDVWPYLGGPLGLVALLVPIALIRYLGVLVATIATISGQLVSSLTGDAFWPVDGPPLQRVALVAAALTALGVALSLAGGSPSIRRRREG